MGTFFGSQDVILALYPEITLRGLRKLSGILGIKPSLDLCKANTLSTVLALWPHGKHLEYFQISQINYQIL